MPVEAVLASQQRRAINARKLERLRNSIDARLSDLERGDYEDILGYRARRLDHPPRRGDPSVILGGAISAKTSAEAWFKKADTLVPQRKRANDRPKDDGTLIKSWPTTPPKRS